MRQVDFQSDDPDLLVGTDFLDDAGVYRLDDERALVQSVDFFTPVVDDPADFGAVAAANALSDIYAMGAKPLVALNLVAFPEADLPLDVLVDILRGSGEILAEAGVALMGGHSIDDREPKFGLAVTGMVHPDRIVTIGGAGPGDVLVLTKPIGVGVVTTAIKRDLAGPEIERAAVALMRELNAKAAEAMVETGVNAATDVTGFGLLGHAAEMADASGVSLQLWADEVPLLPGSRELAERGVFPGGSSSNLDYLCGKGAVTFEESIPEYMRLLLADAVTSGGLLISVPEDRSTSLLNGLHSRGTGGFPVGRVDIRRDRRAIEVIRGH